MLILAFSSRVYVETKYDIMVWLFGVRYYVSMIQLYLGIAWLCPMKIDQAALHYMQDEKSLQWLLIKWNFEQEKNFQAAYHRHR